MAVPQPPVLAAEERAWNYWFVDGLTNLVVGANTLLLALAVVYPPRWPPKPLPIALWLIALVLYVAVAVRYREIVEWLKARTTYPRTGYVQAPFPDPEQAANFTTISLGANSPPPEVQIRQMQRRIRWTIVVALAAVGSLAFRIIEARWKWTVAGILFSVAMILARKDYRLSWILPVGFPILGLYITALVPRLQGSSYFICGMGLLFVLDGAVTLIRYLLRNPKPKAPAA
ncbi:MAG TPA: hypothetical protein VIX37_13275 [Candidatus Sulfotelmatobacter sp.]